MPTRSTSKKRAPVWGKTLLQHWIQQLASPTPERPCVRCLSQQTVRALLQSLMPSLREQHPSCPSLATLQEYLLDTGLLTLIPLQDPDPTCTLYYYDLDQQPDHSQPGELLQAVAPQGVICYWSAIELLALSSHPPTWHHIALRVPTPERMTAPPVTPVLKPHSLGKKLFVLDGCTYYLTRREDRLLHQTQRHYLDPRAMVTMTGLEQTLLDTLHRPLSCGGPEVVFEAWQNAYERINLAKMTHILQAAHHLPWVVRATHMLRIHGIAIPANLHTLWQEAKSQLEGNTVLDLLPGYPGVGGDIMDVPS